MKDIEKKISPFIAQQFPSFYQDEGQAFIAFVKAYYEWLEQADIPSDNTFGHIYQARSLPAYRDIDTTVDEFIVQFKEKYLKNIQFDTATNKRLLVKNSLDLYRSKGTERSIDLFFKLVYGTQAEISYPAEKIFRASDGIWEKPQYLEITASRYNVDYVGKEIIGARSGARAFVERFIRRKTQRGYVNILYVSDIRGEFLNNEVIGINLNNVPQFDSNKRARMVGSVDRVIIQDKGQGFEIGDIVTLESSQRGKGAVARVSEVSNATGIIDFIFLDGGYGYTIDAQSLISEKVISLGNVVANTTSSQYFRLFEQLIEPVINLEFTTATANIDLGDTLYRYASNGSVVGVGRVIDIDQIEANGTIAVSHVSGTFVGSNNYYTAGNTKQLFANTIEDKTVGGKVMGIPEVYTISVTGQVGNIAPGQLVYQSNNDEVFARGIVNTVTQTATGNVIVVTSARGAFKNSNTMRDATYSNGIGTITSTNTSALVVGTGTQFNNNYIGSILYQTPNTSTNTAIGVVESVTNATALTLTSNATASVTTNAHSYGKRYQLQIFGNTSVEALVDNISLTVGVYDIRRYVNTLTYTASNNESIINSPYIYQYNTSGNVISKGMILTSTFSSDGGANTGTLTFVPLLGYFNEASVFYAGQLNSNTSTAESRATVVSYSTSNTGGDYIASNFSGILTQTTTTTGIPTNVSYGSGAGFGVATIGDTEVIFIGTDLIGANNVGSLDYNRKRLNVSSSTNFNIGDYVSQSVNKVAFNPNTAFDKSTGFISIPNANTRFTVGDNLRYEVATGNTEVNGLVNGDYYHVRFANSSGLILSYPYRKTDYINTGLNPNLGNNAVSETGHYLYKQVYGTVFDKGSGYINIKDEMNLFGVTNTTATFANSVVKIANNGVNTNITSVTVLPTLTVANQAFSTLSIRDAAYGFPKNPLGDLNDIIYSCLNFGRFEIGTIGGLDKVDPGSEYNIDPYVLAFQPYIYAFKRNDFVFNITGATRTFVDGERIEQTLPTLIKYDLEVADGVYGNTYNEISRDFDSDHEVVGNTILINSNTIAFNSTDAVTGSNTFIAIPDANVYFSVDDYVRYYTYTGNTAIGGLSNNSFYYVTAVNSTGLSVSTTMGGANVTVTGANVQSFNSNTGISADLDFISIAGANSTFANGDTVRYYTTDIAITGLSNGAIYYVRYANSSGLALSATPAGSNVQIIPQNPGSSNHFLTYYNENRTGHYFRDYVNPYIDGDRLIYTVQTGNTALGGLTAGQAYYVVNATNNAISLSSTKGGSVIALTANSTGGEVQYLATIPGYLPGDSVYQNVSTNFNANTEVNANNSISLDPQPFTDGDYVTYTTATGNTVLSGLANGSSYYVINATANAVKLTTQIGNTSTIVAITASGTPQDGHYLSATANGTIDSVYLDGGTGYVRVKDATNTFANGFALYSYTNPYLGSAVSNVDLFSVTSTARGIVKSSNGNILYVKRLSFENTFREGELIRGDVSGATATLLGVAEDEDELFPIGLNADIEANTSTANGQIAALQIIDSGFGYSNSELVQYVSNNALRAGTAKIVIEGTGIGQGFYRSSKGFLSDNIYIHDGDYYQEYSYEILSKLSVDKYADMFKKVMHVAGTKFFGSVSVFDEANVMIQLSEITTGQQVSFNAKNDVDSTEDKIDLDIEKHTRNFNALADVNMTSGFFTIKVNPFIDGDLVRYTVSTGNTILSGLTNNDLYYVVQSNTTGIKLSTVVNGIPLIVNTMAQPSENGHFLTSYTNPFANGDAVVYTVAAGNTAISPLANSETYYVVQTTPISLKLSETAGGNAINITASATSEVGHYLTKTVEEV